MSVKNTFTIKVIYLTILNNSMGTVTTQTGGESGKRNSKQRPRKNHIPEYGAIGAILVKKEILVQAENLYGLADFDPEDTAANRVTGRIKDVISSLTEVLGGFVVSEDEVD